MIKTSVGPARVEGCKEQLKQVAKGFESLSNIVGDVVGQMDDLEQRLEPVVLPRTPETGIEEAAKEQVMVPIANQLAVQFNHLVAIRNRIVSLIERLEI